MEVRNMNNKGASNVAVISMLVIFMVATVVGFGWWAINKQEDTSERFLQQIGQQAQEQKVSTVAQQDGKIASLKLLAYDRSADDPSTIVTGIPTYCYDSNEPGKFIIDGTVSTTDRYTVQTVTGKTIKCMAVNQSSLSTSGANGYYGDWNEIDMKTEKEDLDLSLHKTARPDQLRVSIFNKDGTTSTQGNLTINFSIGADSSYSLNKIRLRQDTANLEWWAGGVTIAMNDSVMGVSTAATNIKNVDWNAGGFTGNIIECGALLDRLKSRSDFRFEFDADSATTDNEPISLIFWDKNYFRSAKSTAVLGPSGESDASTPLNVGSNDFEIIAMCGFNNNN